MDKIKNFFCNHFDFKFDKFALITLIVSIILIPASFFMPEKLGYENGIIENIQMVVLFAMIYFCATAKYNKRFFNFALWIIIILILREINCFRTLLYPIPGEEDSFYPWKSIYYEYFLNITSFSNQTKTFQGVIKPGPIVHCIYGIFMAIVALLFFIKKLFIDLWKILKNVKIPFWIVLMLIAISFFARLADTIYENSAIEETTELIMYTISAVLVFLYTRNKNYSAEE